ncbi:ABC transporter transmembrane domain-containing protein [Salinisphaera sp. Q1T1-3]|uniref:ABC transporter transmembrane domain-containing protein n=1 Tax=Salinisphaera sp. Q1T1-3 TaxID=2321229 RepID=UPI000E75231B|nr:ABC transporter transmembrane domain-containing protein [Salinisphaera sp. Q1T1-3]RJS93142.1 ATP-binding cassette domain-containing protein [Salinisphaera sp. Q1T1-3]
MRTTSVDSGNRNHRFSALFGLWPFLRPHRGLALGWLLALVLSSGASLVLPVAVRHMIDRGFTADNAAAVDRTFAALFLVAFVYALAMALRYFCITLLGERALASLRGALYRHLVGLDMAFFDTSRTGELMSRLGTDAELVQTLIGSSISTALRSIVMLVGASAAMVWTSPRLAGLTALIIPTVVVPILVFGRRVQRLSRHSQDQLAEASAISHETLNAVATVKAYGREHLEGRRYGQAIERALHTARRRIGMRAALIAGVVVLVFGAITLVLWIGALDVLAGTLEVGILSQFVLYAVFAASAVGSISNVWGSVLRAAGAMGRIADLFAERSHIVAPAEPEPMPTPRQARIRFERVAFAYPTRTSQPVLEDIDLAIVPGETVALVGPSGAGKSTLLALLLRFHDPVAGAITWNGVDLKALSVDMLRQSIALVPQDTVVFAASVADNIRFSRPTATDAEVRAAAQAAEAHTFIAALAEGYDTRIGERGVGLSGGQRQRLAIARAILRDAPLLLLDEATSALDAQSEAAIQQALARLAVGRTTLVVAHRLSTVQRADRTVVMDKGRIVAQGTHDSLLRESSLYAELARLQFAA